MSFSAWIAVLVGGGILAADEGSRAPSWPFVPLERPSLAVSNGAILSPDPWARDAADAIVLAALRARGLEPSEDAERRVLARRLYLVLLGEPPRPEDVDAFVSDSRPDAYERLVDSVLANPAFGERFGRHWLDVVRYTESQGFEYDRLRDHAWRYRDWVADSFRNDEPYDQFVRKQIAGDVIEPVTREAAIATGFLVCGPWDQAGNSQANEIQRKTTREEELEGLVGAVGQAFLGLTVNCARCHDHKFDPIEQGEYYRVRAVFDGIWHGDAAVVPRRELEEREAKLAQLDAAIRESRTVIAKLEAKGRLRSISLANSSGELEPPEDIGASPDLPIASWTFDDDTGRDARGRLHGTLIDGAVIEGGRLRVDGRGAHLRTEPIDRDIREKTLEARLTLSTLDQGGGAAISIETLDGSTFDAVVYAEREPRAWVPGSNGFVRTRDVGGAVETSAPGEPIHVAITYALDGTIAVYRNGERQGVPYRPSSEPMTYRRGDARIVLGLRHTGGGRPFLAAEIEEAHLWGRALTEDEIRGIYTHPRSRGVSREAALAALEDSERQIVAVEERRIALAEKERAALPSIEDLAYIGSRRDPGLARRLVRGSVASPAELVAPAGLEAISVPAADLGLAPDAPEAERRRRFAEWLVDPRHPLTARVIVNRVWGWIFGRGIVETPNDFGAAGSGATHPELIDLLAIELVEDSWSLRRLVRRLVLSSTFRQSSAWRDGASKLDAGVRWLWRFPPRRLEAEAIRDSVLIVSGRLNPRIGGPSFRPFTTSTFGSSFYAQLDEIGPEFERRTIYRMNVNSGKSPFLDVLDCPDPSVPTPRRRSTTTPLQALALMNSSFIERQTAALADRALAESGGDRSRAIGRMYALAYARPPSAEELAEDERYVAEEGLASLAWIILNSSELIHVR
jgi:hypothetical protein